MMGYDQDLPYKRNLIDVIDLIGANLNQLFVHFYCF